MKSLLKVWVATLSLIVCAANIELLVVSWLGYGYTPKRAVELLQVVPDTMATSSDGSVAIFGATVGHGGLGSAFARVVVMCDLVTRKIDFCDLDTHESFSLGVSPNGRWIAVSIHAEEPVLLDRWSQESFALPLEDTMLTQYDPLIQEWEFVPNYGLLIGYTECDMYIWEFTGDAYCPIQLTVSQDVNIPTESLRSACDFATVETDTRFDRELTQVLRAGLIGEVIEHRESWGTLDLESGVVSELYEIIERR